MDRATRLRPLMSPLGQRGRGGHGAELERNIVHRNKTVHVHSFHLSRVLPLISVLKLTWVTMAPHK